MAVSSAGEGCHKQMEAMLEQVVSAVLNYLTDPVSVTEVKKIQTPNYYYIIYTS